MPVWGTQEGEFGAGLAAKDACAHTQHGRRSSILLMANKGSSLANQTALGPARLFPFPELCEPPRLSLVQREESSLPAP